LTTFERGFADAERAAAAAAQAAGTVVTSAKQLQKAAIDGDIAKMRKASGRLESALEVARQEVANSCHAWPYPADDEESYLRNGYEGELIEAAKSEGLKIHRQDDRLVAFPSLVRVMPGDRAVRIGRTRVTTIRPSRLVALLRAAQTKKPKFASDRFLEALYRAYGLISGKDGMGKVVPLTSIYEAMTLLPGAGSEYGKSDFGKDLFLLNVSGLTRVRSGARLWLPASTSTKDRSGVFSFVAEDGEVVTFWGLRFTEE
jgi:hypothetical protein